jgi:hypothetical protein
MKQCIGQEFQGNVAIWLATKCGLHRSGFTLQLGLLWWRTSSMGENWHKCHYDNILLLGDGVKGRSMEVMFHVQPQSIGQETWPPENSNARLFFLLFFHLVIHTNPYLKLHLVLGWNSWPTGALLHCSLNRNQERLSDLWKSTICAQSVMKQGWLQIEIDMKGDHRRQRRSRVLSTSMFLP